MSFKCISSIPAVQTSGVDGSVESVLQWISHIQEEWFLVFDNADDPSPEVVAKFIPPGNRGNILITSRNQSMRRVLSSKNIIEINEMGVSDAVALLLKASYLDNDPLAEHIEAAKNIVTELGCIPLAVNHAGAYIEAGNCDIKRYLKQFSLHQQALMSDATFKGASGYNQTVYGTWDLSFKEIEKRARGPSTAGNAQAAQAAILILQICAFYHHSNISKDIFQSAAEKSRKDVIDSDVAEKLPHAITSLDYTLLDLDNDGHWDDFIFGQGVSVLLSFSLIKRGQSSEMLFVHPLVHCWSREKMLKSEQQRICQIGSVILSCAIPRGYASQDYKLRQLIFPHIKANELYGSQVGLIKQYHDDKYTNFSLVLRENGDWSNAEQLDVQVLDMRKKLLGIEHPLTLTSMVDLANTYQEQGRWNEAEDYIFQVMSMRKKLLGEEHPDTLESMANLASIHCYQGKWNEAEQLNIQVIDMCKKVLGVEHQDTLTCMANLAHVYCNQGKLDEAEQLEVQIMNIRKKVLGAEHPQTLIIIGNLASTYSNQGRWNEAEQLNVQVMDMRKKVLGAEHPQTITSMGNLANTYRNQGRWNEAEQLNIQVLDMSRKVFGVEHPDTLISMGNLASTYQSQGRWNEAEQLEVQVMDIRKKVLGEKHPQTLTSMSNLANTYNHQGRWNEAEQLYIQVVDMSKKLLGAQHPYTLKSMGNLGSTYQSQGRWNEAEQLAVQVMNMRKKLLSAQHPDTITSMEALASIYHDQGKINEAEQLHLEVMNIKKMIQSN